MSAKVITFFSNKGGVGKTFVTVNIATSLAMSGYRVLIIDANLQAGQDMARMLNLSPRHSIVDAIPYMDENAEPGAIKNFVTAHSSGLEFIPAVTNTKQFGHITPENIKPFLKKIIEGYDYVLIDGGQNFSETLITILDQSNMILLVATPDILAVYQIKACLELLASLQYPLSMVKLILNRSESRGSVAWQEVRSALTCEIFGHIPSDGKLVGMALNRGIPCVIDSPKSGVAEAFNKMVAQLKKDSIYVLNNDIDRSKSTVKVAQPGEFWQKFGISQQITPTGADQRYSAEEDEILTLKRKVHQKLVDRLNQEGIKMDTLGNEQAVIAVKKKAMEVVGILVVEEGGRLASVDERVRLVNDIVNEALGLGPLEEFLADADVTDIMCNTRHYIYVEKNGKLVLSNRNFISNEKMIAIIERIISPLGRRIDESTPMVDARLPDGSRINAIIPPLALDGPMITIRKFGQERLQISELLSKYQSLTQEMSDFLQACVVGRKNIIVSGGTGAGKTTLLNVISEFIPDGERIITIEDAAELKLKKTHWCRLESRPSNVEGKGAISIRDLFVNCLRMRPDRIVIGECRGAEVLDMLQAMNTGHDGSLTTLHANTTRDALTRLHAMILLAGIELPVRAINEMIASAIDLIVQINRFSDGSRKITGITEVTGLDKEHLCQMHDVFEYKQKGLDSDGQVIGDYKATGYVPKCYEDFVTTGIVIDKNIFNKS